MKTKDVPEPPVIVSYSENFRPLKTHQDRARFSSRWSSEGYFWNEAATSQDSFRPVESTDEISSACTVTRVHVHTAAAGNMKYGNMKARVTRLLLHPRSSELDLLFVSRGAAMFHSCRRRNVAVIRRPSFQPGLTFVAFELYLRPTGTSRNIPAAGFNRVKFVSRRRRSVVTVPHGRGTDNESHLFRVAGYLS